MQRISRAPTDRYGNVLFPGTLTVYVAGTLTKADLFSDNGVTPLENPVSYTTDQGVAFYVASGRYDLKVSVTGYGDAIEYDVIVFDPSEEGSATVIAALGYTPENVANKDTGAGLGTSDTKYPTQHAVKQYADAGDAATLASSESYTNAAQAGAEAYTDSQLLLYVPKTTTVNGHALSSNVTVTAADVGLGNVTNDAQTKAAVVPNTAPAAGQVLVGNAGGTAYAPETVSGDVTLASTGVAAVASVGGSTAANIHSAELATNAATNANTASTIVKRDSSGNFSAGTITAALTGTASGNATKVGSPTTNDIVTITSGGDIQDSGKAFSTDGTLASNSDAKVPTEKAVKTYADAGDAATLVSAKAYTDTSIAALDAKDPVAYCSTSNLAANYANGSSGVGATLTSTSNGPLIIDGITTVLGAQGSRILVAGQSTDFQNGWYVLSQQGIALVQPWILTRDTLSDQAAEIESGYLTSVKAPSGLTPGGSNDQKIFISIAPTPFTVGSSSLTFGLVGGTYAAGSGLSLSGVTFSLNNVPDGTPHPGSDLFTAIAAPSTPASGKASVYVDSTSKAFAVKNDAGTVSHTVQSKAAASTKFLTAIADDGTVSNAQPVSTDISGLGTLATQNGTFSGTSSGTNTGDETTTTVGALINGATSKTTPVDADYLGLMDSAASNILKKLSWANLKATAKTYFDTLYSSIGATFFVGTTSIANNRASASQSLTGITSIDGSAATLTTARAIDGQNFDGSAAINVIAPGTHAATSKTTPVDADELPLVDSAASNVLKKLTWSNLKATLKTYFDTLYAATGSGGALVYLTSKTWSGVSTAQTFIHNTDFDFSTYDEYQFQFTNLTMANDNNRVTVVVGTGAGPTYDTGNNYDYSTTATQAGTLDTEGSGSTQPMGIIDNNSGFQFSSSSSNNASGWFSMASPRSSAAYKFFSWWGWRYFASVSGRSTSSFGGGGYRSNTALTGIKIQNSGGNWAGTIRALGVKNS